jgi:enoyl-CoA hydratase
MTDRYAAFDRLKFDRPAPRVLRLTLSNPGKANAVTPTMHRQLEEVWAAIDADPDTRVTIITGEGRAFCAGGALDDMPVAGALDPNQQFSQDFNNATRLVRNIIASRKPIVSAINGAAVGAGLALALLADVPIAARTAKLLDGHVRIGVAAGDHAAIVWPLLCGMAKAKYYLLTNRPMTGEEAERNNLVALAVDAEALEATSIEVALELAAAAPTAVRMTKYVLNHWLRQNEAIFDLSAAFEMVNFSGSEAKEALKAMEEKRPPDFTTDVLF